jgi:hypothetical protein
MNLLIMPFALVVSVLVYRAIASGYQKKGRSVATSRIVAGLFSTVIFMALSVGLILVTQPDIDSAVTAAIKPDNQVTAQSSEAAVVKKLNGLGFNTAEYLERFKKIAQEGELKTNLTIAKTTVNVDQKIHSVEVSKHLAMLITADKKTDEVITIVLIGDGDGTLVSGLKLLMGFTAAIAASNPDLSKAEREDVLKSLIGHLGVIKEADAETLRNGVKYHLSRTETVGTWLIISSENAA